MTAGLSPGAAERYEASWPTAKRWAERYRRQGVAAMANRSSRPHHSPFRTPQPVVRKIVHLRWKQRQVSRWDTLKDMVGVLTAFADEVAAVAGAHLILQGPDPLAIA